MRLTFESLHSDILFSDFELFASQVSNQPAEKRAAGPKRISAAVQNNYVVAQNSGALTGSSGTAQPSTV